MDIDLFIDHKFPYERIAVQYAEEIFAHLRNEEAVLNLPVRDFQVEGEIDILSVVDGLQLHFAQGDLLLFSDCLLQQNPYSG